MPRRTDHFHAEAFDVVAGRGAGHGLDFASVAGAGIEQEGPEGFAEGLGKFHVASPMISMRAMMPRSQAT